MHPPDRECTQGKTIGSSILLIKTFIGQQSTVELWDTILARFDAEDREEFSRLTPAGWGSYRLFDSLLRHGAAAVHADPAVFADAFGAFQVEHDTAFLYKMALKFGGPGLMVLETDQLWRRYHNTGHLKVYEMLRNSAKARVADLSGGSPLLCVVVGGFIRKGLELAGASNVAMSHERCVHRGDANCEYIVNWN